MEKASFHSVSRSSSGLSECFAVPYRIYEDCGGVACLGLFVLNYFWKPQHANETIKNANA